MTAPMISQSVSSMLSMPPRDTSRSISAMPESIGKPVAIACHTALIDSIDRRRRRPSTKPCTTSGCRNGARRTPANSVAAISASDAGTLRIDSTASSTSGSRLSGVMW